MGAEDEPVKRTPCTSLSHSCRIVKASEESKHIHSFIHSSHFYSATSSSLLLRGMTGENGIGQNGTYKMVRTKWHEQNGSNFYTFQFNRIEFLFSNHKSQISGKPKWV